MRIFFDSYFSIESNSDEKFATYHFIMILRIKIGVIFNFIIGNFPWKYVDPRSLKFGTKGRLILGIGPKERNIENNRRLDRIESRK